jgi:hypothetical protein
MSARQWKGTVRGDEVAVQFITDDDGINVHVDRDHKGQDGWSTHQWADVEERPSDGSHRIWVAEFDGNDQLLINWWPEDDRLTVAFRGYFQSSWGAPITFEETK